MTVKTIDDLITELEEARDELGGDAPVRVAYQENYPLRGTVAAVTVPVSPDEQPHCADHIIYRDGCPDCKETAAQYAEETEAPGQENDYRSCWLAVGSAPYDENPYASRWAWGRDGEW